MNFEWKNATRFTGKEQMEMSNSYQENPMKKSK
jgi:hypothetical protein